MPLTQAHPAVAIPLRRFGLPLSALVVGSMAPDFSKFIWMSPNTSFGHSVSGVFWFCIPSGLLALLLFHRLFKEPLLTLLPRTHQEKLAGCMEFSFFPPRRFALIICALVIGALSHLIWDSFTHFNGYVVLRFPQLTATLFKIRDFPVKGYSLLQHGSTVVGLTLLTVWYVTWFRSAPIGARKDIPDYSQKMKTVLWLGFIILALIPGLAFGAWRAHRVIEYPVLALKVFIGRGFIGTTLILCIELLFFSVIWHLNRSKKIKVDPPVTNLPPGRVQSAR